MPRFRIEALETFDVRTVYIVVASSAEEAEARCKSNAVGYDRAEIEEGGEEWIETLSVEVT